jgi:protein involved in polysaccharide export with SLBB domain
VCRYLTVAASCLVALCGCSTSSNVYTYDAELESSIAEAENAPKQVEWRARESDEIAPGNELAMRCGDDPKLNGKFRVGFDGKLKLPYEVNLKAGGLKLEALSAAAESEYKKYLTNPKIQFTISEKASYVDVRGLVTKPGPYLVKETTSLDEIIGEAGGLQTGRTGASEVRYVRIEQLGVENTINLADFYSGVESARELVPSWQGGERIFFQNELSFGSKASGRQIVSILGQVKSPGEYEYQAGWDFFEYLVRAGGPTDRADMENIYRLRSRGVTKERTQFGVRDHMELVNIRPGDTLILQADNPSKFEKDTRSVGGLTSVLTSIATVALVLVAL